MTTPGTPNIDLGARIRTARTLAGYQKQIDVLPVLAARGLDVAQSSYSGWETGKVIPRFDDMIVLADVFAVSLDYFAGRTELPDLLTPDERGVVVSKDVAAALDALQAALTPRLTDEQQLALRLVEQIKGAA